MFSGGAGGAGGFAAPSFFQPMYAQPTGVAPGVAPPPEVMPPPTGERPIVGGVGAPPPPSPSAPTMYPAGVYGQMTTQPTPESFPVPSSLPYPNVAGNPFYAGIPQAPAPVYPDPSMVDTGEINYGIANRGNFGENAQPGSITGVDFSATSNMLLDYGYTQAEATAMPAYERAAILGQPVFSPFGGVGPDGTQYTDGSYIFYPDGTIAKGSLGGNTIVYRPGQ